MTRKFLSAFIVFTILGIGVVFWFVQGGKGESRSVEIKEEEPIRVLFVGDIMLSRYVGREMEKRNDYLYPFREVAEEIQKADIAFGNLEGPISDRGSNQGSIYSFRADPRVVEGLAFAGFDVIGVANNHIWDWGRLALEDTITLLKENGIDAVGAGRNEVEANAPVVREVRGTKIAFLAYTNLYPKSLEARGSSTGISHSQKEKIVAQIRQLDNEADVIVVSFHWGDEYQAKANASQREIAYALIDAGAELVIGHQPHLLQEVERYPNPSNGSDGQGSSGWIAYSLGNFVFDQSFSEETMGGLAITAVIKDKKVVSLEEKQVIISRSFQPAFQE